MASKKFGTFAGVFTPSILTILGVIMYMRMGWVVGNAGLIGTIIIVLIAHVIAVSTGLSVSSVATDKKIGAGGIYYVLSRSMGIPIGGSIGIALYVGTAFSIALYLIGFAESFNGYFGLGMTINAFRITGTVGLIALTALALISTSAAIKAQFFILAAIILSLIAIFFGSTEYAPETVNMYATSDSVPLEVVFAIFFPAVTGFTAGIAMSGDLQDPKKAIPVGTLLAIGTGLIVYIGLAFFLAYNINSDVLKSDYNILMKMAFSPQAVVAGIWGATLSSALGGILGGPRILQAMSLDKVTPKIFGKGKGKSNEPVNALILVFLIAEAGILIGELDVIARVVSMFYLTAYGFINISYFLESWANPDFQPTFKIKRWIGLVGFIACFGVMFQLDMIAMIGAFIVVGLLYFWLQRKQIQLQSNDVWQSVWSNVVNKGLKKLEHKDASKSSWNPNIILFSGETKHRTKLLELSKMLSGQTGVITDFKLVEKSSSPFARNKQAYKDEVLEKLGIYGRKVEVEDPYSGIENIASTYGFSGIEPNTVMMNWSRTTNDPERYAEMTQKLIHLDYNLLYLDYDERTHFGNFQTIDLWWRETDSNNAELMLNIARNIALSPAWTKPIIRVLFVNHNNSENAIINSKISKLIEKLRIDAKIKIINNGVEQKSFYEIIELQSAKTDLILLGIPNVKAEQQAEFILNTDHLFETVGTTLLIKASNDFNVLDLDFAQKEAVIAEESTAIIPLETAAYAEINEVVAGLDAHLSETAKQLMEPALSTVSSRYAGFVLEAKLELEKAIQAFDKDSSVNRVVREIQVFLNHLMVSSEAFKTEQLPEMEELLKISIHSFQKERAAFFAKAPRKIHFGTNGKEVFHWQEIIRDYHRVKILPNTEKAFNNFGLHNFKMLSKLAEGVKVEVNFFMDKLTKNKDQQAESVEVFTSKIFQLLDEVLDKSLQIKVNIVHQLNVFERSICNEIIHHAGSSDFYAAIKKSRKAQSAKEWKRMQHRIGEYAEIWHKNQVLAHNQLQSDFNLSTVGLSVLMVNELIKSRVNRMAIKPQQKDIKLFAKAISHIETHFGESEMDAYQNKVLDKLAEGMPNLDFTDAVKNEEDRVLVVSEKAPELVHLISADSYNSFQNGESDDIEDTEVSLANIQNYIIRTAYLSPLQDSLHELEQSFQKSSESLFNYANLIKHILSEPWTEANKDDYQKNIQKVKGKLASSLSSLEKMETTFTYDLDLHVRNMLTQLNIQTIIETLESYAKVSGRPVLNTRFQKWYDKQKLGVNQKYEKASSFVLQRKRDVDAIKFRESHSQYLNHIELTNQFVNTLDYQEGIEKELSFYYKKLFAGSHLGHLNPTYKARELSAAKIAIARIDSGVSGAMMILGTSLSGKTYFVETISNSLLIGEKYYFVPVGKQKYNAKDIDAAFQNVFGKSGNANSILSQLEDQSILIFDDLESWWTKSADGAGSIEYLLKLIEKFGHKHYFVLSCNMASFDIIRKATEIDKQLIATILVPPASRLELKEILLTRHRTAGDELWYDNHLIGETKKTDSFFNDIYALSKGNVGVALNRWIHNMSKGADGQLVLEKPVAKAFPQIDNPDWKIVLYLLIIHGSLSQQQIKMIFKEPNWIFATLKELEKTGLVSIQSNTLYTLNHFAKPYVELWLGTLKILN